MVLDSQRETRASARARSSTHANESERARERERATSASLGNAQPTLRLRNENFMLHFSQFLTSSSGTQLSAMASDSMIDMAAERRFILATTSLLCLQRGCWLVKSLGAGA